VIVFPYKKDFADVIKLRILRWRDYPGLSGWAPSHHINKKEAGKMEDVRTEAEVRVIGLRL
jgi:hypothetical protein